MVVYQLVENYVLQPAIIGKAAQVSGFTVLASVLAFGALFGLIGAIVAVPIAAGIQIVAEGMHPPPRRARIAAADAGGIGSAATARAPRISRGARSSCEAGPSGGCRQL